MFIFLMGKWLSIASECKREKPTVTRKEREKFKTLVNMVKL